MALDNLENLYVSSLNVNSLTYSKFLHIKEIINKLHILALIDTRIHPTNEKNYKINGTSKHLNANTASGKKGIFIFYKNFIKPTFNDIIPGQLTEMTFQFSNVDFQIFFIYGPSENDNPTFFDNIQTTSNPNTASIIMGDWNVIMDTNKDRTSTKKYYKPLSNVAVKNMAFEQDLVDPWRQENMSLKAFSWEKWDKTQSSRIDYALINDKALTMHQNTTYHPPPFDTDHKRLQIAIKINKFKRGPGFPRVKYEMYSDPLFVKTVNEMIDTTIKESQLPPENTLDLILFNTTTIAREITRINKQTKEGALRYLENEIANLKNQADALEYNDPVLIENIKSYEAQYIEMQQAKMEENNYLAKFSDYTNPHMPSKAFKPPPLLYKKTLVKSSQ